MAETDPVLTPEQFMSPQGCGSGTENACYALGRVGTGETECLLLTDDGIADIAGIKLGWRMNIDPTDGIPWCPKGAIGGSKTAEQ